ncbi:MAG: hypothetical protein FP810_04835 [Desulfocapsa sp.]|nr:hypothetical protein [Desulfocapsa sp.]MBU3944453.1 ABC transporter substrate-binding protein [Pseudomonadota bacterium]MCG2744545.1 ABC transporter substrate-binding protein [Desulfobacteraceae bacterium]
MKKYRLLCPWQRILSVVLLVIFLHAGQAFAEGKTPSEKPVLLRIGYLPVLAQLPLIVSYDRDRFSYQNVRVELTGFKSSTALEAAFRVKAVDIAYLPIPTIFAMRAEGINVLMGNSLHQGGSSLVTASPEKEKKSSATVYGIPGLTSSEFLIIYSSLSRAGLSYGDDFKVVAVQLDSSIEELKQGHVDGLFLPEPYPTMASLQLSDKVQLSQLAVGDVEIPQAALAFNSNLVTNSNNGGLLEWLGSIERACRFLEEDIQNYGGAQTILTQQLYFGFEPALIRQSFSNRHLSPRFSSEKVALSALEEIFEKMISLKLLQKSVNANDMLLDPYLLQ